MRLEFEAGQRDQIETALGILRETALSKKRGRYRIRLDSVGMLVDDPQRKKIYATAREVADRTGDDVESVLFGACEAYGFGQYVKGGHFVPIRVDKLSPEQASKIIDELEHQLRFAGG